MTHHRNSLLWISDSTGDPSFDLRLEEVILECARQGQAVLLTCRWIKPVLVLGYSQEQGSGFDRPFCCSRSIPVLRRITGGTGVFYNGDMAFSLALPGAHPWSSSLQGLYDNFVGTAQEALSEMGVLTVRTRGVRTAGQPISPICFEGPYAEGLTVEGKRILGSAQARKKGGVLVHSALVLNLDPELEAAVFGVSPYRIEESMAAISLGASQADSLADGFAHRLANVLNMGLIRGRLPEQTMSEARQLCAKRLLDPKWTIVPPPMHGSGIAE